MEGQTIELSLAYKNRIG